MFDEALITQLFDIGSVKFGNFTLKSGIQSPIYVDLRLIVSYPKLLKAVATAMWNKVQPCQFDCLCGVPYTALPMATAISLEHEIPMIMRRKEVKEYGTKRAIEGVIQKGDRCLVIEDLITSGSSIFETIAPLEHEGLQVSDIVVLLDREQGGRQVLHDKGYQLHAVLTITEFLKVLEKQGKIVSSTVKEVLTFIESHQTQPQGIV